MAQVNGICAVDRPGMAHPREFLGDALRLGDVCVAAGRVFLVEPEQQLVIDDAREFQAADRQAADREDGR